MILAQLRRLWRSISSFLSKVPYSNSSNRELFDREIFDREKKGVPFFPIPS